MPRFKAIDPKQAGGPAKKLLDGVQQKLGMVPNIIRTFANSPAALQGYLGFSGALQGGVLPPKLREQIAITVAEANDCGYCLAAHCAIGKSVGLSDAEADDARSGNSPDGKVEAALKFARHLVDQRGWVSDEDVEHIRQAGYSDEEITEIIANVALNIFTNYFNHVAATEVDFPEVPQLSSAAG